MQKKFKAVLIVNWNNGSMRVLKRQRTKKLSPFEIPIKIDLTINTPEYKEIIAKGEVTISETQVSNMVIERL